MDGQREDEYIFSFTLSKLMGLYQILDPNTRKMFGRNVYHTLIRLFGLYVIGLSSVFLIGLYDMTDDVMAFTYGLGCVENCVFSTYKIFMVIHHSKDIWKCVEVTGVNFTAYGKYDRSIFKNWRKISLRVSVAYVILSVLVLATWIISPLLLNTTFTVKHADGSHSDYRISVLNIYLLISDTVYNNHYSVFFSIDTVAFVSYVYFSTIFDIIMLVVCCSVSCHLSTISNAITSLGHASAIVAGNTNVLKKSDTDQDLLFDDIKMIFADLQKVLKKTKDFFNIFRTTILLQIFMSSNSHIIIWFIAALNYGSTEAFKSVSVKQFCLLPMFSVQLFMVCYLFETINEKNDSIVFAVYSSNWMDMDMRNKKLILLAMNTINSSKLKMKFTNTKIVNLEMFSNTMRLCYSIFSMLIKYNKNNTP